MDFKKHAQNDYMIFPQDGLVDNFDGLRSVGLYAFSTVSVIFRHYSLDKIRNSRILDFGSGSGRIAKLISPHSKEYYCADISPSFLKDCKENLINVPQCKFYEIKNPSNLDFEDNFFEFTFAYLSIRLDNKILLKKTLLEIDRISKNFCLDIGDIKDFDLGPLLSKKELVGRGKASISIEELNELFNSEKYIFEILSPEPLAHRGTLFIYKISDNLKLHLKFGPHVYEKGSKAYINTHEIKTFAYIKKLLDIKPIQIIRYLKRIFRF